MGELARERRARSIHISRGHLAALAVAWVLWTVSSVSAGYLWGRQAVPELAVDAGGELSDLPDPELAEALSRLEAASKRDALDELTVGYADEHEVVPPAASDEGDEGPLSGDPVPAGAFAVSLGQFDVQSARAMRSALAGHGIEAWRAPVVTGGQITVRLAVGGFASEEEARNELGQLASTLQALGIAEARVVSIR